MFYDDIIEQAHERLCEKSPLVSDRLRFKQLSFEENITKIGIKKSFKIEFENIEVPLEELTRVMPTINMLYDVVAVVFYYEGIVVHAYVDIEYHFTDEEKAFLRALGKIGSQESSYEYIVC